MKRLLGLCVAAALGAVLGWTPGGAGAMVEGAAGEAQGRGAGVAGNGDSNGDGEIDIADASYLLNWLFLGGAEPVPCASGGDGPAGLPETGQTLCFNEDGWVIDCASPECPGQDAAYATGCPSEGRFADNGDGTVSDRCTGLIWQQETADLRVWCVRSSTARS
jgi:hypothetical protein